MLKQNLDAACRKHELAKKKFNELKELAQGIGLNTADGAFALHKAAKVQNAALQEYREAVKQFSDFILSGRLPPGFTDDGPKEGGGDPGR